MKKTSSCSYIIAWRKSAISSSNGLTAACLLLLPRLSKLSIPVWVIRSEEEEEEGGSEAAAEIGGKEGLKKYSQSLP